MISGLNELEKTGSWRAIDSLGSSIVNTDFRFSPSYLESLAYVLIHDRGNWPCLGQNQGTTYFFQRRMHVEFVEFVFLGQFSKSLITPAPGAKWPGILLSRSAAKSLCFSVQDMGASRTLEAKIWINITNPKQRHKNIPPTITNQNNLLLEEILHHLRCIKPC